MDILRERSYQTPLSNSYLLPLLLVSLLKQRYTPHTSSKIMLEYDYIIVGGGAAGSVVASRLSEESSVNVLLLEAGPEPPILTEVPALDRYFWSSDVSWNFKTVPQKYTGYGLENRQLSWSAGKMLGGSSSLNSMEYVRGNRKNFDDWAAMGAKGWSYDEIFPYFLKMEDNVDVYLADGYHAIGGPITMARPNYHPELKQASFDAATDLGYRFVDPNAATQIGLYDLQGNIRNNQRCSTVKGYLLPAENRRNLDILLNAIVSKVIIEDGRATGVEYYSDGQVHTVKSKREVIISAGTVNTPKILMLSGIGPREELQKFGIPVIADLPVGKNLQDHIGINLPFTMDPRFRPIDEGVSVPSNIIQYINSRSGPLASLGGLLIAFLKGHNFELHTANSVDLPDCELYISELTSSGGKGFGLKTEVYQQFFGPYENQTITVCLASLLNPKSRGTITLMSRNPFDPPVIDPNYLEFPNDVDPLVEGLKICKNLINNPFLTKLGVKPIESLVPGCEMHAGFDDAYFRCMARSVPMSIHHYVGTSKMGDAADPSTVVDPELRVKNIDGLRVVDASIMPTITSGNTQTPTIVIAEKASDMIKDSLFAQNITQFASSVYYSSHI